MTWLEIALWFVLVSYQCLTPDSGEGLVLVSLTRDTGRQLSLCCGPGVVATKERAEVLPFSIQRLWNSKEMKTGLSPGQGGLWCTAKASSLFLPTRVCDDFVKNGPHHHQAFLAKELGRSLAGYSSQTGVPAYLVIES